MGATAANCALHLWPHVLLVAASRFASRPQISILRGSGGRKTGNKTRGHEMMLVEFAPSVPERHAQPEAAATGQTRHATNSTTHRDGEVWVIAVTLSMASPKPTPRLRVAEGIARHGRGRGAPLRQRRSLVRVDEFGAGKIPGLRAWGATTAEAREPDSGSDGRV